jgi:hypothetical protein
VRGQLRSFGQGKNDEPDLEDVDEDDFVWRGQVDGVDGRHLHTTTYHHQVSLSKGSHERVCTRECALRQRVETPPASSQRDRCCACRR